MNLSTVREPPYEDVWVTAVDKDGRKYQVIERRIKWPAGTKFNASRFHCTNNNWQCQACGHAIKDPGTWVPFLIDSLDGAPHAFLTGKDGARKLVGCEIEGEVKYENLVPHEI